MKLRDKMYRYPTDVGRTVAKVADKVANVYGVKPENGFRSGKGWWKPIVSGISTAAAAGLLTGSINPKALLHAGKAGYDTHQRIKEKYNIPWMGRVKKKSKKSKKRK